MVRSVIACLVAASAFASLLSAAAPFSAGQSDDRIDIISDFSPALDTYDQGQNFSVMLMVTNAMFYNPDFTSKVMVTNISSYFSWLPPNTWLRKDVSSNSTWLSPSEFATFTMNMSIPANATPRTHSYAFRVEYLWFTENTSWGVTGPVVWQSITYHDFVVIQPTVTPNDDKPVDYIPFISAVALLLAVGSVGAFLYHTRSKDKGKKPIHPNGVEALGLTEVPVRNSSGYPVILAMPGEQFPIEKGFIYLVKEKRPGIAFAMFNEATTHGAKGMLVVREHPNRLKQLHEFDAAKILWLTRRVGVNHIDPTELSLLSLEITRFVEGVSKSVVLLEGLEYIITQNDFETVLRFVNHLHDFVLAHDSAVIIVLDPRVLNVRELALLERAARIVEPVEHIETRQDRFETELEA
ncbi:MAG: DUF835 domain-containing protein [Thermoplasmatota archaeon]